MSVVNLKWMLAQADDHDLAEARLAYARYNCVMRDLSEAYGIRLDRVVAAFVSLSPNNDYIGNLRSTVSVLEGVRDGVEVEAITVSTYKHCGRRAYEYATGLADFVERTKGPKILSFYHNLLDPLDPRWVTVDGHMVAAWRGDHSLTMKQAIPRRGEYEAVRAAVQAIGRGRRMVPNQIQAAIWFARKRLLGVRYEPQLSFFHAPDDRWRTAQAVEDIRPYPRAGRGVSVYVNSQYRQGDPSSREVAGLFGVAGP